MDKQFRNLLRGKAIGGSLKMDNRRLSAKNVVPVHISLSSLKRSYLCMGESSPCYGCEVQCYYGRLYLEKMLSKKPKEKQRAYDVGCDGMEISLGAGLIEEECG